jgi:hypothetical protein
MKKLLILLILFSSCQGPIPSEYTVLSNAEYNVIIDGVNVQKYSSVWGHIYYNNIYIPVTNTESGYYYKEYALSKGDVVKMKVEVRSRITSENTELWGKVNFNLYEK